MVLLLECWRSAAVNSKLLPEAVRVLSIPEAQDNLQAFFSLVGREAMIDGAEWPDG
jgi:hypothetical protein